MKNIRRKYNHVDAWTVGLIVTISTAVISTGVLVFALPILRIATAIPLEQIAGYGFLAVLGASVIGLLIGVACSYAVNARRVPSRMPSVQLYVNDVSTSSVSQPNRVADLVAKGSDKNEDPMSDLYDVKPFVTDMPH